MAKKVIDMEAARNERRQKRAFSNANKYQKEKQTKDLISRRRASKIFRRRVVYCSIFLILATVIGLSVYNLISLRLEEAKAEAELEGLLQEKEKLEEQLTHIDSKEYIEQKARQELKMILPGETLYVLMEEDEDAKED